MNYTLGLGLTVVVKTLANTTCVKYVPLLLLLSLPHHAPLIFQDFCTLSTKYVLTVHGNHYYIIKQCPGNVKVKVPYHEEINSYLLSTVVVSLGTIED